MVVKTTSTPVTSFSAADVRNCVASWIKAGMRLVKDDIASPLSRDQVTRRRRQTTNRGDRRKQRHNSAVTAFQARVRGSIVRDEIDRKLIQERVELVNPMAHTLEVTDSRSKDQSRRRSTRRQSRIDGEKDSKAPFSKAPFSPLDPLGLGLVPL